jgi:Cof subfamily protein (haloacid dehalogenase superfamily)
METKAEAGPAGHISLFVADVDGTLVTPDKELTPAAIDAARLLREAGITFTLVSSRPPRGMAMFQQPLALERMMAAFDGAALVLPDLSVVEQHYVPEEAVRRAISVIRRYDADVWLFADDQWLLTDPNGPYVPLERHTLGYDGTVVTGFEAQIARTNKLVGSSREFDRLEACERELAQALGDAASVHRSQRYYLDVTHASADKGYAVRKLAASCGVPLAEVAVIGDMSNDLPMFKVAGLAVAMGNATAEVKASADFITSSNTEDGFARAVTECILPRARRDGGTA